MSLPRGEYKTAGREKLPAGRLGVRAGTGLAVIGMTSAGVTEVAWTTLVTLRPLGVVLTALWDGRDITQCLWTTAL